MEWISVKNRLPKEAKMSRKPFEVGWLIIDSRGWRKYTNEHPANWNNKDKPGDGFTGKMLHIGLIGYQIHRRGSR